MTEKEYLQAGNLAKIRMVEMILRDCFVGEEYGISKETYTTVMGAIQKVSDKLFTIIEKQTT